jgi:hypothetical protein
MFGDTAVCTACGGMDEACCAGEGDQPASCNDGLACTPNGDFMPDTCQACGGADERCCSAGDPGFNDDTCDDGVCVVQNTGGGGGGPGGQAGFCRTDCGDNTQQCCEVGGGAGGLDGCTFGLDCGGGGGGTCQ